MKLDSLDVLEPHLASVRERTTALTEGLSAEALLWQPAPDKWGVAQVLEHLHRLHALYEPNIERALAAAGPDPGRGPLQPSLFARVFNWAIDERTNVRMPTAPFMEPRDASPQSPERFLQRWGRFGALMRQAQGKDLRAKVRLPVPVLKLRLGEVFPLLTGHAERHLAQAERVRQAPGFPA